VLRDVGHHFAVFELDRLFGEHDVVLFEGVCDLDGTTTSEPAVTVQCDTDIVADGLSNGLEEIGDFFELIVGQRVLVVGERVTFSSGYPCSSTALFAWWA
jgi:hypothetical protein